MNKVDYIYCTKLTGDYRCLCQVCVKQDVDLPGRLRGEMGSLQRTPEFKYDIETLVNNWGKFQSALLTNDPHNALARIYRDLLAYSETETRKALFEVLPAN